LSGLICVRFGIRSGLAGNALQESVDGLEERVLLMLGQALDLLQTAEDAEAGFAAESGLRSLRLKHLVSCDFEGLSEADDHIGVETELAALVIGEDGLDDAGAFGEFDLSPAALLAKAGKAMAHRL
jgi:hypothetical protein